jgi:hypothetical protein
VVGETVKKIEDLEAKINSINESYIKILEELRKRQ